MTIAAFDANRPSFAPYGFTCRRRGATKMPRPDRHNEIELNLIESGSLVNLIGGQRLRLDAGRLYIFWAAMPHQILEIDGVENLLVATIPLAWCLQWRLPGRFMQPLLQGKVLRNGDSRYAAEDVLMLSRWIDHMEDATAAMRKIVLLEIQARMLRFAFSGPSALPDAATRRGAVPGPSELSNAERLACFIAQHCTRKLSAKEIGDAVDLHPNYAMGIFKKTFGITLNQYLTQQRISRAQRMLVTTQSTITDIALSAGFTSISRFNASFREICECSPSQYRLRNQLNE